MDITLTKIVSTVCTGNQRSEAVSYPYLSSPGSCRMEIQTTPSGPTSEKKPHLNEYRQADGRVI